jgi:SAM-dependent methyltransferase
VTPHESDNRRRWDELAAIHFRSDFYDVAGFKAGRCSLRPLEVAEVGDVSGLALLHLQCHFGLDTLSWARRGAAVTGVDASAAAIDLARQLAAEVGLAATFVCAPVQDLPALAGLPPAGFDIVFVSYGALCWLPDLGPWARTVAHFLKPGGFFYLAEIHPFADVFDDSGATNELRVAYGYFPSPEPLTEQVKGTYADRSAEVVHRTAHVWSHSLAEVLTALAAAGLRLEWLREHDVCVFQRFPWMTRGADGWWRLPEPQRASLPLMYSLRAACAPAP